MNQPMIHSNLEHQSLSSTNFTYPRRSDRRFSFTDETAQNKSKDLSHNSCEDPSPSQRTLVPKLSRSKKQSDGPERILPVDFEPSPYTVIIGRGKRISKTVGNQRLRILSKNFLPEYAGSMSSKSAKTRIVNKIVDIIKSACADNCCEAAFVRYCNGRCYEVDDSVAREKVGYQLRDLLGDKYESSSKSKVAKKHRNRLQKQRNDKGEEYDLNSLASSALCASMDENFLDSIPVQHPISPRHEKRFSFDSLQLLTQPLIGRGSFVLDGSFEISLI